MIASSDLSDLASFRQVVSDPPVQFAGDGAPDGLDPRAPVETAGSGQRPLRDRLCRVTRRPVSKFRAGANSPGDLARLLKEDDEVTDTYVRLCVHAGIAAADVI